MNTTVVILTVWNLAALYGAFCFWKKLISAYRRRKIRHEVLDRALLRYFP